MDKSMTIEEAISALETGECGSSALHSQVTQTIKDYVGLQKKRDFERKHKEIYEPMDTVDGKLSFVRDYIESAFGRITAKVHKFPEVWDGIELRWLIADIFTEDNRFGDKRSGRYRRYRNHMNELDV